jgi:hypothetical protein
LARHKGHIRKEVLEDLYLKQHLSLKEIAKRTNRARQNVWYYLRLYKIPKRERARRISKTDLEELYEKRKLSLRKICELHSRSVEAIRHDLAFYGIACRTWHGGRKGPPVPRLSKEVLADLYLKKRKSAPEIGEETGRTKRVILLNLAEYGIPIRSISEARKNGLMNGRIQPLHGESHPFWLGGVSFEPYSPQFNEGLKEKVRRRDGYVCQKCGMPQEEVLKKFHKKLAIHHVDYNKANCDLSNLVSLCSRCSSDVNFNREYWTRYFSQKIIPLLADRVE